MATFGPGNRFKKAASNRRVRPKLTFEDEETDNGSISFSRQPSTVKDSGFTSGEKPERQPTIHHTQDETETTVDDSSSVSRDRVRRNVTTTVQNDDNDKQEDYHVVTASSLKKMRKPKSKGLSSSLLNSQLRNKLAPNLPSFPSGNATRTPMYSKAYLDELRDSTPTTPAEYTNSGMNADEEGDLDMLDDSRYTVDTAEGDDVSAIPDEALINHLIERRHKKAESFRKDEFISLDDEADNDEAQSDMDGVEMDDKHEHERTSRLQREDDVLENEYEMLAEGSDGRIPLSATQEAAQKMQRRRDIEEMINDREDEEGQVGEEYGYIGENDSGSDSGWEQAQIRKGAFGSRAFSTKQAEVRGNGIPKQSGTRQPSFRVLQQLPDLESVIKRLTVILDGMREERDSHLKLLEELNTQKEEIEAREKELREALSAAPF
ncbi:nineteen complex-related protein 2-domain-containing protein [Lipomyces kononenkoae]|uniref:Nineteen complex-related protein 2-domain-containing protein n=1 Tax=Lipomyces kononenkoae TaxID=34357 RepID=A0ACC3T9Z9_LIPKO